MSRTGDYVSPDVRREVARRAGHRCECCLMPDAEDTIFQKHQVDHIRPLKHRGTNNVANLAYACFQCNSCKGTDLGSIYDLTGEFAFFFNPRTDLWADHFALRDFVIEPLTPTGWVTALLLQFNTPQRIDIRQMLAS